jgi:hypothetical protein
MSRRSTTEAFRGHLLEAMRDDFRNMMYSSPDDAADWFIHEWARSQEVETMDRFEMMELYRNATGRGL